MSIPITDKFKPKGAGGYPLMDAEDILMPDGTRLSEFGLKIVTYDLVAMGLPNLNAEGEAVSFETDTTELTEDLATSIVTLIVNIEYRGMVFTNIKPAFLPNCNVATFDMMGIKMYVSLYVTEGQVLVRATVEQNSGVSSWNDLTDKPFYEEGSTEVIVEEATQEGFSENSSFGCYMYQASNVQFSFEIGATYTVLWDGEEYVVIAQDAGYLQEGAVFVGNGSSMGFPGNNEPFAMVSVNNSVLIYAFDTNTSHTIGISKGAITIKTLDSKFLPTPVSIDLSGFESEGKIVETYADGSTATTVMEFDENGKPTKITDGNGNVTVLTW